MTRPRVPIAPIGTKEWRDAKKRLGVGVNLSKPDPSFSKERRKEAARKYRAYKSKKRAVRRLEETMGMTKTSKAHKMLGISGRAFASRARYSSLDSYKMISGCWYIRNDDLYILSEVIEMSKRELEEEYIKIRRENKELKDAIRIQNQDRDRESHS